MYEAKVIRLIQTTTIEKIHPKVKKSLTDDATIELHSHGHPSTIRSGVNSHIPSSDRSV